MGLSGARKVPVSLKQSVRLNHFEAVQDVDFEGTWQDAIRK